MELSARIKQHTVVNDIPPFVLFALDVYTSVSHSVLTKRYSDFKKFQRTLCYFAYERVKSSYFLQHIPKLPGQQLLDQYSIESITQRKQGLNKYLKLLTELHNSTLFPKDSPWVALIREFFQVDTIEIKESAAAAVIQNKFKKYQISRQNRAKKSKCYAAKGYVISPDELPDAIITLIFSCFGLSDLCRVALVSRRWKQVSAQPILWNTLHMYPNKFRLSPGQFSGLCERAWRLQVLDFRYCEHINSRILLSIAHLCNPLT